MSRPHLAAYISLVFIAGGVIAVGLVVAMVVTALKDMTKREKILIALAAIYALALVLLLILNTGGWL